MNADQGNVILRNAIKDYAKNCAPDDAKAEWNGGTRYNGCEIGGARYGFIYTTNGKNSRCKETLDLKLTNLKVIFPEEKLQFYIDLDMRQEHLIVLRANSREGFGMGWSSIFHPIDEE